MLYECGKQSNFVEAPPLGKGSFHIIITYTKEEAEGSSTDKVSSCVRCGHKIYSLFIYNCRYDTPDRIPDGSIQRAGENILALIKEIANLDELIDPRENKHGKGNTTATCILIIDWQLIWQTITITNKVISIATSFIINILI